MKINGRALLAGISMLAASVAAQAQQDGIATRLARELVALGFADGKLPRLAPPFGQYMESVSTGNLLYLTGTAPMGADGKWIKGRVPDQLNMEGAIVAARLACMRQIARLQQVTGDLGRVKRIVTVNLVVSSAADFTEHTRLADACSSVFVAVFAEAGRHTRGTVGVSSLPFGVSMEAQTLVELKD